MIHLGHAVILLCSSLKVDRHFFLTFTHTRILLKKPLTFKLSAKKFPSASQ